MKTLLQRLEAWLAIHDLELQETLRPGASRDQLNAVGELFERPLPEDLCALYAWHNGQAGKGALPVVAAPDTKSLLHQGAFMSLEHIMLVTQNHRQLRVELRRSSAWWSDDFLPILDGGDGDFVGLDLASGGLQEFQHETPDRPWVHRSISDWLERVVSS